MSRRFIPLAVAAVLLLVGVGCSVDTEFGGVKLPNSRPDTRLTGQPPTLLEAGFTVQFNWTGTDPDGKIKGYQWKISDNGIDGISPRDTLTVDPLTGAELNPWRFTTVTDTTFLVLADQSGFPGDDVNPRSFRSHTLFVRAMDETGAVDPSPAQISFTSTTLVPKARAVYPKLSNLGARQVPMTATIGWSGTDPDFDLRVPTKSRFLWKKAIDASGNPIQTSQNYEAHYAEVIDFADPEWSDWTSYAVKDEDRRVSFDNLEENQYYLFAVQVQDTAGAVSVGLGYQVEVAHVKTIAGVFYPSVTLTEPFLGTSGNQSQRFEIAAGQPLNFSWTATAADYNGTIASYRHGWDVIDPEDPNDPGWAVPPGTSDQNLFAATTTFTDGSHTFTLRVLDDAGEDRTITWFLTVVPFVDPGNQLNLMVLDQVKDDNNESWQDESNNARDDESYRNAWWRFLAEGVGGVSGINWERDWRNNTDPISLSDIVYYKVLLCYARSSDVSQSMFSQFRPEGVSDNFVWLTPYQEQGGNLFLVGGRSMESFLESLSYMVPVIFDSREEFYSLPDGSQYVVGFGTTTMPDDTVVERGPRMYPYATAGITALDWTSPTNKNVYARTRAARYDRVADCVGIKAILLDEDFANYHLIGPGVIADTMWTEPEIDWPDRKLERENRLVLINSQNLYPFRNDEFIDANIASQRSASVNPQECPDDGPNGYCVQPMFRGMGRFDYVREWKWAHGDPEWPSSEYSASDLDDACGQEALGSYLGQSRLRARTTGLVYGYMSYKTVRDKPRGPKADVYWGFDPYRFDHEQSREAIRWVLEYFGLTINQ